MVKAVEFEGEIWQNGNMNAAFVNFPFNVQDLFQTKGQVKINALFDGSVQYRGSLATMGGNQHCLGITIAVRKVLGKTFGDTVHVKIWRDPEERTVVIPEDVSQVFTENPAAKKLFDAMNYTHRKEYIRWIEEARKSETRERRKIKMISMIMTGRKGI